MRNQENKLEKEFNGARLFIFALPTIAMMVFLGLYTVIDTIFVARFVSTDALAAINVVTPVIGLTVGIGTMLAAGGNAIISRNMGEGEEHQARENFTLILLSSAAAFGTGCGYLLPAVVGVIFFLFEKRGTLFFCGPRFRMKVIAESCLNGSSEMVGQSASAVMTLLFNLSMLRLAGEDGVAWEKHIKLCRQSKN